MAHNSIFTKIFSQGSGLSVKEIARCLCVASKDVGKLCCHRNINKDAKYKPLAGEDTFELTEGQRKKRNYGYDYIPYYTTIQQMATDLWNDEYIHATNYDAFKTPWGYINLTDGDKYRVLDFDGYKHDAQFFGKPVTSDKASTGESGETPLSPMDKPTFKVEFVPYDDGNIWGSDISLYDKDGNLVKDASQVYCGIMVCRESTTPVPTVVATTPTNSLTSAVTELDVDNGVQLPRGDAGTGEHYVTVLACMILSDRKINSYDAIDSTNKGFYVPVIPTRNSIRFFVDSLEPEFSYDEVMPWMIDEYPQWVQPSAIVPAYSKGDKVTFDGKYYVSLVDNNEFSPAVAPTDWQESAGRDVTLTWYAKPNGNFYMKGKDNSSDKGTDLSFWHKAGLSQWAHCVWSDYIPLYYVTDDDDVQLKIRYRAHFNFLDKTCTLNVTTVYDDMSEMDVPYFSNDYTTAIDGGDIMNDVEFDESSDGNYAYLDTTVGSQDLGWTPVAIRIPE